MHAAAPVAAAADRLDVAAVDHHPGVLVAVPAPAIRGADGIHDPLAEHQRKRIAHHVERRQGKQVHPDIVVLVVRSRLVHGAVRVLEGVLAHRAVGPVRLVEQRALPVARLAEQVVPGDGVVVFRAEELVVRHVGTGKVVDRGDQPRVVEEADRCRKEGLRHAERHVHLLRGTPLAHDVAVLHHDAAQCSPHSGGADTTAVGLAREGQLMVERQVAGRARFRGHRELDGFLE